LAGQTLYQKLVDRHCVHRFSEDELLLYIDRTVLNEYTSPQAFTGLRDAGRKVRHPEAAFGVIDHVNPTDPGRGRAMGDPDAERQVAYFRRNCVDFGIELIDIFDPRQGIEHVVAPEEGFILPGMVVAAGDSHTTTYGALGALGFGIGTSDIEHCLATQTLRYRRQKAMRIEVAGQLSAALTAKDLIMYLVSQLGADGASGHAVEFAGSAVMGLSVEGRMTLANMAVELGARGVVIQPDEAVLNWLAGRRRAPREQEWDAMVAAAAGLVSDPEAHFHAVHRFEADDVAPMVSWGISPDQALPVSSTVPTPHSLPLHQRQQAERALDYMGLAPGTAFESIKIDRAFIGSCTNSRIEDLRSAAEVVRGRRVAPRVRAMVVPGSGAVRRQAEAEGLDAVFLSAGFEWREPGCSMCLGMNPDVLGPEERCASSTNRNFEGRQGPRGRTHLMSPAMVAAAAVTGHITDVRRLPAIS
jgi:3-isopropylmalate/(R)-2-methylmalate dehydratase large subunit